MGRIETQESRVEIPSSSDGNAASSEDSRVSALETTPALATDRSVSRISTGETPVYKVYKRRFFGLIQLVLLNIAASWDWISFAPVSTTSAQYFNTTETAINWLSTAFLFIFVVATPFVYYALSRHGPRSSIIAAACLLLVGNWIRYGGTKSGNYGVVMFGQLVSGLAQPFVLAAPTTYSNLWFSTTGRTTATALASLANPFGAALGQLINPFWASDPSQIPNMVLYISIISTIVSLPSFFIPSRPPTPPSAGASAILEAGRTNTNTKSDLHNLFSSFEFYAIFLPFSIYVGFFNSFSTLLNQFLQPYGYTETEAGIAGALLILVGLVSAAISSPIMDKYKFYLSYIKVAVPVIALSYLVFIWAPSNNTIIYAYVVCSILGAASFGLVPVALEFLVEIHHPLGPELASSLGWSGGQLLGGIFIIVQNALKNGPEAQPPYNMNRALIFEAIVAMATMPLPLCLGLFGRRAYVRRKRWEADKNRNNTIVEETTSQSAIV